MKPLHTSAQRIAYLAKLECEARSDALAASYCGDRKALAQANRRRRRVNSELKRIAQLPAPQLLIGVGEAGASIEPLVRCNHPRPKLIRRPQ